MKKMMIGCFCALAVMGVALAAGPVPPCEVVVPPAANANAPQVVAEPAAVKVVEGLKGKCVEAVLMQDAVLAAREENMKPLKAREMSGAVMEMRVGTVTGITASGAAGYKKYPNRNATLLAQRIAYVRAFLEAKKGLAAYFDGATVEACQAWDRMYAAVDTDTDSGDAGVVKGEEQLRASVKATLSGYAVFSVAEDQSDTGGEIFVTVILTPHTRAASCTLTGGMTVSATYPEAYARLYSELTTGLLPMDGARVMFVRNSDGSQTPFFVGYGSELIRKNRQGAATPEAKKHANNVSALRAQANLLALLAGESFAWENGHSQKIEMRDATSAEVLKAIETGSASGLALNANADQEVSSFLSIAKETEFYKTATGGQLPPGVQSQRWVDDAGDWAYTLMIYNPGMTLRASRFASEVKLPDASGAGVVAAPVPAVPAPAAQNVNKIPTGTGLIEIEID